jgi:membrane-bound metal-dependent hydrolase YbcI (DUF457 family)
MLGRSHTLVGAVGWLAVAPPVAAVLARPLSARETVAGAVLCGGAALLPDIDHPSSTVARTLGPVTRVMAAGVAKVSGGHRHATHSLLGCTVFGVAAAVLVQWPVGVFAAFLLCAAWFLRLLGPHSLDDAVFGCGEIVVAAVVALVAAHYLPGSTWMVCAITAGAVLHLAGDLVTKGGLPLLWPWERRFSLGLFRAGAAVERLVVCPVLVVVALWLTVQTLGGVA